MSKLVIITEPFGGIIHQLGESWTTVGRADGNMFQIADSSISGRHCEVKARAGELLVRDLNSTNGTFIGGARVSEGTVRFGQSFRLGNIDLRFEHTLHAIPKVAVLDSSSPAPRAVMVLPSKEFAEVVQGGSKFNVLFVDDSMAFLESFAVLCGELSAGQWRIHTAASADCALKLLDEYKIDLAIVDINMPMLDGIQLLTIIKRRHANVKVAVMTGFANEANRAACLSSGADLFLEKASGSTEIRVAYRMLEDILEHSKNKEGFSGTIQQINLPDVIQLECLNRKSIVLEVQDSRTSGQIYIKAGEVTHAAVGTLIGEQAFYQLLALRGGEFQIKPFKEPPRRTIDGHWEILLMDAARASDEDTSIRSKDSLKKENPQPQPSAQPPGEWMNPTLGSDIIVAATYDGQWKPGAEQK
jgi:CheY-like chemotaxis protein